MSIAINSYPHCLSKFSFCRQKTLCCVYWWKISFLWYFFLANDEEWVHKAQDLISPKICRKARADFLLGNITRLHFNEYKFLGDQFILKRKKSNFHLKVMIFGSKIQNRGVYKFVSDCI